MACAAASTLRACKFSCPYACTAVVALRRSELGEVLGLTNELCAANLRSALLLVRPLQARLSSERPRPGFWGACTLSRRVPSARGTPRTAVPLAREPAHFYAFIEVVSAPRRDTSSCSNIQAHAEEDPQRPRPQGTRRGGLATAKGCPRHLAAPGQNDARRQPDLRLRRLGPGGIR